MKQRTRRRLCPRKQAQAFLYWRGQRGRSALRAWVRDIEYDMLNPGPILFHVLPPKETP